MIHAHLELFLCSFCYFQTPQIISKIWDGLKINKITNERALVVTNLPHGVDFDVGETVHV